MLIWSTRLASVLLGRPSPRTVVKRSASWTLASLTVTVKLALALLPAASLAVHDTVVTPMGDTEPEAGVQPNEVAATLSDADAVYVTVAPAGLVAFAVTPGGTVIVGGVASRLSPAGGVPAPASPQQTTVRSLLRAQLCHWPVVIWMTFESPAGGVDWPRLSSVQQTTVPLLLRAHV